MNIIQSIKSDISDAILNFFIANNLRYDLKSESKQIDKIFSSRLIALLNVLNKFVSINKRNVHISDMLAQKMKQEFSEEINELIMLFRDKFINGENMNGHLSRGIFQGDKYDQLLNTWNIKHFHLSKIKANNDNEMKSNRSNYILFSIVDSNNVYFIDVRPHPHGSGFSAYEFLTIIYNNNWMQLIGAMELHGIISMEQQIQNDQDIYKLYKNNINIAFQLYDKFYTFMGISTAGNKVEHTFFLGKVISTITNLSQIENIEYKGFVLLLNDCLGVIKYTENGVPKEIAI